MTPDEAVARLREAGLHARLMDMGDIIGGSYVDRSGPCNMVEGSFRLQFQVDGTYRVRTETLDTTETLEAAVALILRVIPPGQDIPAPPRPSGPQEY